ncbi:hypothetical protein F5X68DRAFT_278691 [Plectosphaerella plurivora]|uniref:Protein CAP22 n=1 Tax=Plectosphaerella plurivora TaxID=936078 RepID=A0A9P8V3T3_9PEZI|nr:hypothetical protein F5X68DRAFT_278691 [Plectosphaerella plurivora]
MRSAIFFSALVAVLPVAFAEEVEAEDVPAACTAICAPVVTLSNTCDLDRNTRKKLRRDNDDAQDAAEEAAEINCICTNRSFDVANVMALCASCMNQNRGDVQDVNRIMAQCSFASTSYAPTATGVVQGINVDATRPTASAAAAASNAPAGGSSGTRNNAGSIFGLGVAGLGAMALGL